MNAADKYDKQLVCGNAIGVCSTFRRRRPGVRDCGWSELSGIVRGRMVDGGR